MQTDTNKTRQEELKKVTAEQTPSDKKTGKGKNHHNSAAYAATMWHSAVTYVKPQKHTGANLS
jgi:hypothetical protein